MSSSFLPNKVNNVTIKKSFPTAINVLSLNFCFYNKQKKNQIQIITMSPQLIIINNHNHHNNLP